MRVRGRPASLSALNRYLRDYWAEHQLPERLLGVFELAREDLFINVCTHGSGSVDDLEVEGLLAHADGVVSLEMTDIAPPFDPAKAAAPDLAAPIEDRPVGGLGLHLVRQSMDRFEYRFHNHCNSILLGHRL